MNENNLDDLVIDDGLSKRGKWGSILTILALLVILVFLSILFINSIMSNVDSNLTEETTTKETLKEEKVEEEIPQIKEEIKEKSSEDKEVEDTQIETPSVIIPKKEIVEERKVEPKIEPKKEIKPKVEHKPKIVIEDKPKPKKTISYTTGEYYIQIGAFGKYPNNHYLKKIVNAGFPYEVKTTSSMKYKVLIGPFSNRTLATNSLATIRKKLNKHAFIIKWK